jgi:hypothetical protein
MLSCEEMDDGSIYLRADYSIYCDSTAHRTLQAYSVVMMFVYPLGTPLLYLSLFYMHRNTLTRARFREVAAVARVKAAQNVIGEVDHKLDCSGSTTSWLQMRVLLASTQPGGRNRATGWFHMWVRVAKGHLLCFENRGDTMPRGQCRTERWISYCARHSLRTKGQGDLG